MMESVIDHPEDLSAEWLSDALQDSDPPVRVTDVRYERIGSGQMGITYRLIFPMRGRMALQP